MDFLNRPTRNLFFTGKGGVGKTSLACATAVALADQGRKVLLVSTDPASNLDEVLGTSLGHQPTPVPDVPNLWAMNIDPEAAARDYRERMVAPYRGVLPEAALASMEEQFSGSCTIEIAAFDEFSRMLGDRQVTADFDHVLFDTAPTGHTLRLLSLPSAWDGFMQTNTTGTSCLGPLAGLQAQQQLYRNTVRALAAPETTTLVLTTTDPAAHVAATVNGEFPNLKVSRIDPQAETAAYTAEVMQTAGASLDEQGKALLEEDLRSPCTEEIAVFRAFAQAVAGGESGFVVLDTAPTGHTILLLDAALAYHREVTRQASEMPESVEHLLPRLRDPDFTRVLIVTSPEATPVHEAANLQQDLVRAGIQPFAWVVNQSLSPLDVADPVLLARQGQETGYIREVTDQHAERVALVPWRNQAPVGLEGLQAMLASGEPQAVQA